MYRERVRNLDLNFPNVVFAVNRSIFRQVVSGPILGGMSGSDILAAQWLRQWKSAGPALEEVRKRELRELTDEEALRISEAVLSIPAPPVSPERWSSSGLVEQQTWFHRLRQR